MPGLQRLLLIIAFCIAVGAGVSGAAISLSALYWGKPTPNMNELIVASMVANILFTVNIFRRR